MTNFVSSLCLSDSYFCWTNVYYYLYYYWLILYNVEAIGCLYASVWCKTYTNATMLDVLESTTKAEQQCAERNGWLARGVDVGQNKAAESMMASSIWSDKKIKGIEAKQCIINTQTHNGTCVWKLRGSEVKPHYAFSHQHHLSILPVNNKPVFFVKVNHDH